MMPLTVQTICAAVGGTVLQSSGAAVRDVTTDSRRVPQEALFIPLVGERFDGHAYIEKALEAGADVIMLDNMDGPTMKAAVDLVAGRALLEASGGITDETLRAVAETGVDIVSIGALTHSVKALDISMKIR